VQGWLEHADAQDTFPQSDGRGMPGDKFADDFRPGVDYAREIKPISKRPFIWLMVVFLVRRSQFCAHGLRRGSSAFTNEIVRVLGLKRFKTIVSASGCAS
jgi:hypothetical protein